MFFLACEGANACLMGGTRGWRMLAHVKVAHPAGKQSGEGRQLPKMIAMRAQQCLVVGATSTAMSAADGGTTPMCA